MGRRPLVLVGFMGSGKSTVGRLVAARTGLAFVDLDEAITSDAGKTPAEIFKAEGEPGFRRREATILRRLLERRDIVLATGGGAAAQEENLRHMLATGVVVALLVDPDEVVRRVGQGSGRPILDQAADPRAEARRLLEARTPYYARAHVSVDTAGKEPATVADEVIAAYERVRREGENTS